jgi:aryl-alcohol dehydrogenase-like predicted oxidoreductase
MRVTSADTIKAAVDAGITVFDTARAYEGNEELLATALRGTSARIVTKGGMSEGWVPDGRAKSILADCEASLAALGGLPIDTYVLHAPDPRTPWATSVRALGRLVDEGLVGRIGVANVNRTQLDQALGHAPIAAVEVALSAFDDRALRGGVLERCDELGITLIAHSPLGGPRRAQRLVGRHEDELARLLALSPVVVAIPGATRPETVRSVARAASLVLPAEAAPARRKRARDGEVVLIMGIPGAGKSRLAGLYGDHLRLNRDERGGSLRQLAGALDEALTSGARRVVLDNTYLTRAARNHVIETASRYGVGARCVWLDTPLAQAQVNLVERLLDRFGALPTPEEIRAVARREPGILLPTSQMRALRELEPPSLDEGWAAVEHVPFERVAGNGRPGVFVAASALEHGDPAAPHLVFDWRPGASAGSVEIAGLAARLTGAVEVAVCPHGAGPPACWCRPPLPGLLLAFARAHGVEPSRSTLIGTSAAHRTLATTLGCRYVD